MTTKVLPAPADSSQTANLLQQYSDRTIGECAASIWDFEPCPVL